MKAPFKVIPMLLAFAGGLLSTSAQAFAACSHDHLPIDGQMLAVTLCPGNAVVQAGTARLPVQTHIASAQGSLDQALVLRFPALAPKPHAVADVDLTSLGISKTLHLTLQPEGDAVRIDHALLLPGPTVIR